MFFICYIYKSWRRRKMCNCHWWCWWYVSCFLFLVSCFLVSCFFGSEPLVIWSNFFHFFFLFFLTGSILFWNQVAIDPDSSDEDTDDEDDKYRATLRWWDSSGTLIRVQKKAHRGGIYGIQVITETNQLVTCVVLLLFYYCFAVVLLSLWCRCFVVCSFASVFSTLCVVPNVFQWLDSELQ